ncbi:MAG: reverse transcriptase domain-containing protein [Ktedonobacteraceae bacterium]
MDIGIWNVRSLGSKEPELVEEAMRYRLDIIGVSETKLRGKGTRDLDHGWKLFYSGLENPLVHAHAGVGILTSPRMAEQVIEWTPVSERVCVLRLRIGSRGLTLVQIYAPNEEKEYTSFLDEVALTLETVSPTDSLMLIGDFNAHVGNDDRTWRGVIGRNGPPDFNRSGRRLLDFCASSGLSIMNTYFQHRDIHKYTWQRESCGQRSLIDFVVVSADLKSQVMDVRVRRGAELSTDHHLVVCRLRHQTLVKPVKTGGRKLFRINWEKLRDGNVAKNFADNMDQRFSQIPSTELDAETEWCLFKTGIIGAAVKFCGRKRVTGGPARRSTPWWTEELRLLVREKKRAYKLWLGSPDSCTRSAYCDAKKAVKEAVASAKAKSWENFGVALESNFRDAPKVFWQTIRRLRSGKVASVRSVKSRSGALLTGEEEVLQRWREYFGELLNPVAHGDHRLELHNRAENSPTLAEVEEAVKSLKPGKAAGVDEIRPEMLKALGGGGLRWLTRVFSVVWSTGRAPMDWQTGVVVPIFKKGDQRVCSNYRGITLLSLPGKAFARVLHSRLTEVVDHKIQEEQCGFRRGRGTTDQLFLLQQIVEKAWEFAQPVYISFVDLEKAYDRVDRRLMWEILEEYGVDRHLIGAISSLYSDSMSYVRILGRKSEPFRVGAGLRQGCVLSPLLFIIYMDRIGRRSLGQERVTIGSASVSHLLFADDLAILAPSQSDLRRALERFSLECEAASMRINVAKTETLVISRNPVQCTLHVSGVSLQQVEKFKYLGVLFSSDGSLDQEIDRRIGSAAAIMRQLGRGVIRKRELSNTAKLSVFRSIFVPTLTYGHENWVMTERTRSRIQAAEMRFLRGIAGLTLRDRVRSSAIREGLNIEPLLLRIERSQLRWLGHLLRMPSNRLVQQIWNACPTGPRPRGRPRNRWRDQVLKTCERLSLRDWTGIIAAAEDRTQWRGLLRGLTPRDPHGNATRN